MIVNVPDGFALVPIEPTEAMSRAAMEVLLERGDIYEVDGTIHIESITPKDLWRAMLAAVATNQRGGD
jgi:hypothetical protein